MEEVVVVVDLGAGLPADFVRHQCLEVVLEAL